MNHPWTEHLFRKLNPDYRHRWEVYNEVLREQITKDTVWLDIGCGTNEHVAEFGNMAKTAIGIDILDNGYRVDAPFLRADLHNIPLPSSYASLITLRMVAEHLERIPHDFLEIDRLLVPGGTLLLLTTNSYSPIVLFPRFLPFSLKRWLIRILFGVPRDDVFPTYHRFNTPGKMVNGVLNMKLSSLAFLEQVPLHHPLLTCIFGFWYSVTKFSPLRHFRSSLLAVFHKMPSNDILERQSPSESLLSSSPTTKPPRLDSVDILRGIIMVVMALDHVRDYFTNVRFDPLDLTQTSAALFFTRWITHYCAPLFVFLAGTGACLSASRGKSVMELTRFLWTRGLFLVIMELTIVRFAWLFNFSISLLFVQVIWAIGVSMICLAGFVHLQVRTIAIIGIAMVVGHNALDGVTPETFGVFGPVWIFLHIQQPILLSSSVTLFPFYPLIPWIGVMAAGYAFGSLLLKEPGQRRKTLFRLGLGLIAAFVVIRYINVYGDLHPWTDQRDEFTTFLSFLNTTKYPPSLDFLLMTLGPAIVALALFENGIGKVGSWFAVYGRVPMFYYVVHLYFIHALVVVAATLWGLDVRTFLDLFITYPPTWGFDLITVYLIWIGAVVALYPLCKWFGELKRRRKDAWLSYL